MGELFLFTDGSVNPQSKIGYGAYLVVTENGLSIDSLGNLVKTRRFEQTSSTKLELQTLLWALSEMETLENKVIIYTDSQNIIGLPGRRDRFEQNDFRSTKNKLIQNSELYKEFFRITEQLDCKIVKIKGHKTSDHKDYIDRLFTLVDKASRKALRGESK